MMSAVKKPIEISSIWHSSQDVIDSRITATRTDEIPNLILSFLLSRCFSNCLFFNGRGRLVRSADKTLMRIRWCPEIRMLSGWPVHFREALPRLAFLKDTAIPKPATIIISSHPPMNHPTPTPPADGNVTARVVGDVNDVARYTLLPVNPAGLLMVEPLSFVK